MHFLKIVLTVLFYILFHFVDVLFEALSSALVQPTCVSGGGPVARRAGQAGSWCWSLATAWCAHWSQ